MSALSKGYKKNHKYKKGNNYYGKNKGNEKGKEWGFWDLNRKFN